eukprot:scaffold160299_cov66-Attheya_sp.AAC.3
MSAPDNNMSPFQTTYMSLIQRDALAGSRNFMLRKGGNSESKPNSYPRPYKRNRSSPANLLTKSDSEKMHCKEKDICAL